MRRHGQARAATTSQHVAGSRPHPKSFRDGPFPPLLMLAFVFVWLTGWGWRRVIIPLVVLAWRLLIAAILGDFAAGFITVAATRAFGPIPIPILAPAVVVIFFGTTALVLWLGRSHQPHPVPAARRVPR